MNIRLSADLPSLPESISMEECFSLIAISREVPRHADRSSEFKLSHDFSQRSRKKCPLHHSIQRESSHHRSFELNTLQPGIELASRKRSL